MNQRLQTIVQTIRRRRETLQYFQEYMAAKMKIGQNCYRKIELGKRKLIVECLLKIAELLETEWMKSLKRPLNSLACF